MHTATHFTTLSAPFQPTTTRMPRQPRGRRLTWTTMYRPLVTTMAHAQRMVWVSVDTPVSNRSQGRVRWRSYCSPCRRQHQHAAAWQVRCWCQLSTGCAQHVSTVEASSGGSLVSHVSCRSVGNVFDYRQYTHVLLNPALALPFPSHLQQPPMQCLAHLLVQVAAATEDRAAPHNGKQHDG